MTNKLTVIRNLPAKSLYVSKEPTEEYSYLSDIIANRPVKKYRGILTQHDYGGIESNGGYKSFKELEVGVARIVEATHCILGSLSRIVHRLNRGSDFKSATSVEKDHIYEEVQIIQKAIKEYSRFLYVDQILTNLNNIYTAKCLLSMKKTSAKLVKEIPILTKKLDPDLPESILQLAKACYKLIQFLSYRVSMFVKSVYDRYPPPDNPISEKALRNYMEKLYRGVKLLHG